VTLPLTLRAPATPRELNFVRSSWTKSALKARPARVFLDAEGKPVRFEQMSAGLFIVGHARYVDRVLKTARVVVADPIAAPGTLAGWLCYEPGVVHYCYVGQTFRRMGVAKMLIGELSLQPMAYSMWTPVLARVRVPVAWTWDETRRWV
jgi:hypothetical protein